MSYVFVSYSGGFIYWVAVKFCKTKLNDELDINKKERNIFTFIISVLVIGFITIKFF